MKPLSDHQRDMLVRTVARDRAIREVDRGRSSFRWYLLASFVTGLLLGAAVARVVGL